MSLVHNERTKLTATYLNGLAIALFAVGSLAPISSYALAATSTQTLWVTAAAAAICLGASVTLRLVARRTLEGLVP